MKNKQIALILTFSFLSFLTINLIAQCPDGDVVLLTQSEVDAFVAQYPNCDSIDGSLIIGDNTPPYTPSDITDISGLSMIELLGKGLYIYYNPFLESLNGLQNITSNEPYNENNLYQFNYNNSQISCIFALWENDQK